MVELHVYARYRAHRILEYMRVLQYFKRVSFLNISKWNDTGSMCKRRDVDHGSLVIYIIIISVNVLISLFI